MEKNINSSGDEFSEHAVDILLDDFCEGRLEEKAAEQLCSLLATNNFALKRYVETMHFSAEVQVWARRDDHVAALEGRLENLRIHSDRSGEPTHGPSKPYVESSPQPKLSETRRGPAWFDRSIWRSAFVASLLGIIAFVFSAASFFSVKPVDNVKLERQVGGGEDLPSESVAPSELVAHILEATGDVTWEDELSPFDLMLRVGVGERIAIKSGVLKLKYFSGAEVILHGPSVFLPTGPASGHLVSGRLTGKVADSEKKEFRLTTPSAEVIDLGTVFGVAVNEVKNQGIADTEVYVFDGEVEVTSLASEGERKPIRLLVGMGVRLSSDGVADLEAKIDRKQFLVKLPLLPNKHLAANEISLIDAFIDGPGLSHRFVATLDPTTGKPDEQPARKVRYSSEPGFRPAVYSEFVDGVFIPSSRGRNIQIDSYGNTVRLPKSNGQVRGTVWARRPVPGLSFDFPTSQEEMFEVWEVGATLESFQRLSKCRLGMIGLHANVGISFDLLAIQSVEGQRIERFRCLLVNLGDSLNVDPSQARRGQSKANVRFYIDGVERHVCHELDSKSDQFVDVIIDPSSRVFTIVVDDAGDDDLYDQVILIDPTIEMAY